MFKKDKSEDTPPAERKNHEGEDTAYEDSWYRSLKALADRPAEGDDEEVGDPED